MFNSRCLCLRLRAAKAPDANADMGTHHFTYAIMPHTGQFEVSRLEKWIFLAI